MKIIGLFPELLAPGGVQLAGRQLAAALQGIADKRGCPIEHVSLNDPPGEHEFVFGNCRVSFRGTGRNKIGFLAAARRAARGSRLIVAAHPHLAPVAWGLRTGRRDARCVVVAHGVEVWKPLPVVRRRSLQRADMVWAPSKDTAEKIAQVQGVSPEKIHRLPWCLDPGFLVAAGSPGAAPPRNFPAGRVVLAVARLAANERYKGIDELMEVLPRLLPAIPDVRLAIVGDGDDRSRLQEQAVRLGLSDRVAFLGAMERDSLLASYRACDVFALPSFGEGFGLVFLEAMAHGKPVVGAACGGVPDIVEDGLTGYLVPRGDAAQLADRLQRLLMDESLRGRMGAAGRERVAREFTFDRFCDRLAELLADFFRIDGDRPRSCAVWLSGAAGLRDMLARMWCDL